MDPVVVSSLMSSQPVTVDPDDTLDDVLRLLARYPFRHLPVVRGNALVGILSDREVALAAGWCRKDEECPRRTGARVADLLVPDVETIAPDAPVEDAARRLIARHVSALPVLEHGVCIGILTATDLLRDLCERLRKLPREATETLAIGKWMHPEPVTIGPQETCARAVQVAFEHGIRHLPVVDGDQLVGMLSDRDLRRAMALEAMAEAGAEIEHCTPPNERLVEQDMTRDVLVLEPEATLSAAAHALAENLVSALPIVRGGRLVGLISQGDLLERYAALVAAERAQDAAGAGKTP